MPEKQKSLEELRGLMEAGQLRPIVGKAFPLAEAAQAIRYLADGKAMGKVVLVV